jgi:hypothetical protein
MVEPPGRVPIKDPFCMPMVIPLVECDWGHPARFTTKCLTLTVRFRRMPDSAFDTFPWPQFADSSRSRREEGQTSSGKNQRLVTSSPASGIKKIYTAVEAARTLRQLHR